MESHMIFKDDFEQLETVDSWEFRCQSDCIKIREAAVEVDSVVTQSLCPGLVPPPRHFHPPTRVHQRVIHGDLGARGE